MSGLLTSCKLGFVFVISLLVMVHSFANNDTINLNNFNAEQISLPVSTDVNGTVLTTGQSESAATGIGGSCLFQRFRENVNTFVNFRSVFPYVYIAIFLFNLIFNPFLIIWILISPIVFNILRSTTTCYIFPVILTLTISKYPQLMLVSVSQNLIVLFCFVI